MTPKFITTAELAARTGVSRITAWRTCRRYPGFAIRLGGVFRIPESHAERIERGERAEAIAADARRLHSEGHRTVRAAHQRI